MPKQIKQLTEILDIDNTYVLGIDSDSLVDTRKIQLKNIGLTMFKNDGNFVRDTGYIHTDNNLTDELKTKLETFTIDTIPSLVSPNAIQNAAITNYINGMVWSTDSIVDGAITGLKIADNAVSKEKTDFIFYNSATETYNFDSGASDAVEKVIDDKTIIFDITVEPSEWVEDTEYNDIGFYYKAVSTATGVTQEMYANADFSPEDKYTGNFDILETGTDTATIHCKTVPVSAVTYHLMVGRIDALGESGLGYDLAMSDTSINAPQNHIVKSYVDNLTFAYMSTIDNMYQSIISRSLYNQTSSFLFVPIVDGTETEYTWTYGLSETHTLSTTFTFATAPKKFVLYSAAITYTNVSGNITLSIAFTEVTKVLPIINTTDIADGAVTPAKLSEVYAKESDRVTSLSAQSTDVQYPSAKCVYDKAETKVNKSGDTMSGNLDMGGNLVQGLPTTTTEEVNGGSALSVGMLENLLTEGITEPPFTEIKIPTEEAVYGYGNTKVDKVEGKGLSTNDYTNEDKAKVQSALQSIGDGSITSSKIANGAVTAEKIANGVIPPAPTIDTEMSDTSENAVQNKVIKEYVDNTADANNDIITYNMALSYSDNLLNPKNVETGFLHQKGGLVVANAAFCAFVLDGVSAGETYSVWKKNSSGGVDSLMATYITAYVSGTADSTLGTTNAHEFTVPANVTRIDFSINLSEIIDVVMIVKGSTTPTSFSSYYVGYVGTTNFSPGLYSDVDKIKFSTSTINSVKSFGAKGDGTTDDTTALQSAFAAGGNIYIPSGTYIVNSKLTIPTNTTIYGDGINSILRIKDNADYWKFTKILWRSDPRYAYSFITTAENSENIVLKNFVVDGGTRTTTDSIWGLTAYYTKNCKIENVTVKNINYVADRTSEVYGFGMFVFHSDFVMVDKCKVEICAYEDVGGEYCNHITVSNCCLGTAWRVPLQFHQASHDIKIIGNTIISTDCPMTHSLITLHGRNDAAENSVSDVIISNNYLKGVTISSSSYPLRGGIQSVFGNEQNIKIINNTFECSNYCITNSTDLHQADFVYDGWQIVDNTIKGLYGINLFANNVLCKNNIVNTTNTAISIKARTTGSSLIINDNTFIANNTVDNNVTR